MLTRRKLEQIRSRVIKELADNRMWKHLVDGRFWLCPFCGMVGANIDQIEKLPEAVTSHLVSQCTNWKNFEGTYVNIKKLEERAMDVLATHKLTSDAAWKFFDEGGRWYCPFCTKGRQVDNLRSAEGMQNAKAAIVQHLRECHLYKSGKGSPQSADDMKKHVGVMNLVCRIGPQIKRRLDVEDIWTQRWADGSWVCPFCHKPVPEVDISSQITRMETAPNQMAVHLVKDCPVYAKAPGTKGQPPHVLKPIPGELKRRLTQLVQKMNAPLEEEDGPLPLEAPLPAPKLSIFSEEKEQGPLPMGEGFARGRVQMARYQGEEGGEAQAEMAMRMGQTRRIEKPPEEPAPPAEAASIAPVTPPPPEAPPEAAPISPEDVPVAPIEESGETITGRKRRAMTGMMQRAKIRLLSMIPDTPRQPGLEVAVLFRPSRNFQGDFYYFHDAGPKRVGVAVYNLSVKGVDMVPLNELFLEKLKAATKSETDPKAVLCRLNHDVAGVLERGHYATVLYGILDLAARTFQFVNAGHCPPILENALAGKDCVVHRSNGIVIGQDEGPMFQALLEPMTVPIERRDMLVLYTEGVLQTVGGPKKREFEMKGLTNAVREFSKQDAHFLVDMTETTLLEFLGNQPQEEDLTVVALRVH